MVMVTRSAYKKACESFNTGSDISQNNIIPPWCSSGRLIEKKKTHKVLAPNWEIRSSYPLRENIWEYLHDDKEFRDFACTKGKSVKKYNKQLQYKHKSRGKNFLKSLIFLLFALGFTMSLWKYNSIPTMDLIGKVIPKTDLISIRKYKRLLLIKVNKLCFSKTN
ncbi:unnamed protein product [Parnassius mnemosyne]|uniref:Uncharacterized protein n=1 Tax=Parnassius mnemosyne TaxID=213953 RepID=A0AAV1LMB5_9NEOP